MILLRLISWQYVRKHLLRTVLTLLGIALGVAVFVGMHTANQSVLFAFHRTIDRIAGTTQLQVSAGEPGFDENVLERVQATPEVRVAAPVVESVVNTAGDAQGSLLILGVDMLGDRGVRDYDLQDTDATIDDPLVFLAQPDSLIVTAPFAERNRLATGAKLQLSTVEGPKTFTVRGIMKTGGLNSAFGGNIAVMDIYAAQKMFGRGRKFDRIDIAANEGVDVDALRRKLEATLGPGFQVETPGSRGRQFESIASVYRMSANITSLFALFIGMFIIYNTFAIAVTQRRTEIGILRALGATRRQVRTLFLAESAAAGVIASLIGIAAGVLIARAMAGYVGALMGEVFGIADRAQQVSADPRIIGAAFAIGVSTSVLAAFIPARSAARVDPVKALQKGRYQTLTAGENRVRTVAAALCACGAAVCVGLGQAGPLLYAGYLLAIVAAVLISPLATLALSHVLRRPLKWFRPVEGALAADSLIQAPRRTSGVVAALMLSTALVIGLGGLSRASYNSITRWLDNNLNPDFFVTASPSLTSRSYRFPLSMADEIAAAPSVELVQAVRTARITLNGSPILLIATNLETLGRKVRPVVIEGDRAEMYREAAAGRAVIIGDNLSLLQHRHKGDIMEIPTPGGTLRLPIAGVIIDYSDQLGAVLMDQTVYQRYWTDPTANIFRVYLRRGAPEQVARQAILDRVGRQARIFVLTNSDVRRFVLELTDQWFGLTYIQIFVAVLVAILGIVNTLTVSITDRRREIGVLRAVGALRNQIRHTVWLESAAIGLLGLVLGLALGAAQLYYSLEITRRDVAGIRLDYSYPVQIVLAIVPVILAAALFAALGPAESSVRGSLVEALEYE